MSAPCPPVLGSVAWAELEDNNGVKKIRSVVVVTPTAEIAAAKTVHVVAITTRLPEPLPDEPIELPRRPLGKTGIDITILDQGTGKGPDVDRLLRFGFARGVRA